MLHRSPWNILLFPGYPYFGQFCAGHTKKPFFFIAQNLNLNLIPGQKECCQRFFNRFFDILAFDLNTIILAHFDRMITDC